jgi:hypothetical protein
MNQNSKVALLLFSFSKEDRETLFFLEYNHIPSQIDVFDCRYCPDVDFQVTSSALRGSTFNLFTCMTSIKSNGLLFDRIFNLGYTHIIYSHHDSFQAQTSSFSQVLDICNKYDTSRLGVIGFNILHDNEITAYLSNNTRYGTLCRTILQQGNGYFNLSCLSASTLPQKQHIRPFAIEIPMWSICLITRESFEELKYVSNFQFHLEIDDISFNFLKNNIPNVCIPSISFFHQQSSTPLFGRAFKSPMSEKQKHKLREAHKTWKKIWKFDFGIRPPSSNFLQLVSEELLSCMNLHPRETIARISYDSNRCNEIYKHTLIDSFYSGYFSYIDIPLK